MEMKSFVELDKDAEGEEQLEEDDCVEEHHEQQVEDSPKRTHTTSSAQDDVDIDDDLFYYTIDKLGRRRKWRKTMTSDANPSRAQLAGRALVETPKKRRGRPPRVKPPPEVEKTPEHDYLPGTSSRIPPVELETSTASTLPDANKEDRVFSFQQWNVDMRPVAENAIRQMYEHMFQHLEGRSVTEEELREVVEGDNVQQLLDKMFKEDEQQGEEDFVIVGVETFSAKKLRFRYFVRIQDELKRHTATPHVRSAVLTFFQYFEYTVAATVTGKNVSYFANVLGKIFEM
uniref:Uncharacterized protein n=1 Tax=Caenorhabditis japonica TaxID=281687 RepID=A0A8R1EAH6_CAEJA